MQLNEYERIDKLYAEDIQILQNSADYSSSFVPL